MPWWGWLLIGIAVFLVAAAVVLYILGKRMQKKQAEQQGSGAFHGRSPFY